MKGTIVTLKMKDLTRRQVRYICFRLQIEADGGAKAKKDKTAHLKFVKEIKEHMEKQEKFDKWINFGETWDVGEKAFLVAVIRVSSIESDWNNEVEKEVKDLPLKPKKKVKGKKKS